MTSHDEKPKKAEPTKSKGKQNMKKLMKKIISTLTSASSLASLLGLAMMIAICGTARADCGLQTLHGSYVFNPHGFNIVNGAAQPIAVFEGIDFNGNGTLTVPFATVSIYSASLLAEQEPTRLIKAVKAPSRLTTAGYTMTSSSEPTAGRLK